MIGRLVIIYSEKDMGGTNTHRCPRTGFLITRNHCERQEFCTGVVELTAEGYRIDCQQDIDRWGSGEDLAITDEKDSS